MLAKGKFFVIRQLHLNKLLPSGFHIVFESEKSKSTDEQLHERATTKHNRNRNKS